MLNTGGWRSVIPLVVLDHLQGFGNLFETVPSGVPFMSEERFLHDPFHREPRVQGAEGVLKNDLHLASE